MTFEISLAANALELAFQNKMWPIIEITFGIARIKGRPVSQIDHGCNFCNFDIWSACVKMERARKSLRVFLLVSLYGLPPSPTSANLIIFVSQWSKSGLSVVNPKNMRFCFQQFSVHIFVMSSHIQNLSVLVHFCCCYHVQNLLSSQYQMVQTFWD